MKEKIEKQGKNKSWFFNIKKTGKLLANLISKNA